MFSILKSKKKESTPIGWDSITIGQFEEMQRLDSKDENYIFNFASIVFGYSIDDFANLPLNKVNEYMAEVQPLMKETPSPKDTEKKSILIGDTEYEIRGEDMTLAQYIDFQASYQTCGTNIAEFLSIILVPKGKTYNEGYSREREVENIRGHFPITYAMGLSRFFFRKLRKSVESSLTFSERVLMTRLFKEKKTLTEEERMEIDKALTGLRLQRKAMREQERELGFK